MISAKPLQETFEPFAVKTAKPIYDTIKGKGIYIPSGYLVKVIAQYPTYCKIRYFDTTLGKFVNTTALPDQLELPQPETPELTLPSDSTLPSLQLDDEDVSIDMRPVGPLVPRIYQEYGITFLCYKWNAELADAPGVGKTLQALEASMRVMHSRMLNVDPLNMCYTHAFQEDPNNTHPATMPEWAIPKPTHTTTSYQYGKTTINVHQNTKYYYPDYTKPVTVIVAPTHLCNMWFKAIRAQYPNEHVAVATNDSRKNRMAVLTPGCRFYVVNYQMMRRAPEPKPTDYIEVPITINSGGIPITVNEKKLSPSYVKPTTYVDMLNRLKAVCVIFDEAHNLKSKKSVQAQVCEEYSTQIPFKFLLTATPIKREADDLHWQLHIIDPDNFPADQTTEFVRNYCFYKQGSNGKTNIQLRDMYKRRFWFNKIQSLEASTYDSGSFGTKKTSSKYNVSFTEPNIRGYILGRSYADVGMYLPKVIPATIPVQMNTEVRVIYERMKKSFLASFEHGSIEITSNMQMLHSLRILTACQNKFEAVQELIEDNEGPWVVFCEYKPSGDCLASLLGTKFISGEIPESEREPLIEKLMAEGKPIVGMGRVIGTGINALADCNTMINFEADYTPGERTQRIGRVQRFSQARQAKHLEGDDTPILLYDVMVTDSIDEKVYEVQRNRGKSIRDIIAVELGLN